MGYDGNGNFLRIHSWQADAAAGIKIRSDRHDAEDDNFADGLSNALTRDGQSQPTADIPMNEFKIIALGAPEDPADAATKAYVDGKRTFTTDIEVTDEVIFKDGPTTRGYIKGMIGSGVPGAMIFEADNDAGAYVNKMTLDGNGLTLRTGLFRLTPNDVLRASILANSSATSEIQLRAYDTTGVEKGVLTAGNSYTYYKASDSAITAVELHFRQSDNVQRGGIYMNFAPADGSLMQFIKNTAGSVRNTTVLDISNFSLQTGNFVAENGGAILRGGTGVLLTSTGATPQIRGSLICDTGSANGTTAVRSYNNAGVIDGLFYVNSTEIASDRNTLSLYHANDEAIWFRRGDGTIKGGVYNYTSGRTELRTYLSNALKNLIGVDENMIGFTYSHVFQYNSIGMSADVWISHRVSSTRAMRFYFAQGGDVHLQESDDNYGSHFINIFSYSRGTGNITFSNNAAAVGYLINGAAGSNNGLFLGTGDGATLSTYNIMLRSWNGIGFPSSLDGVNRIFMNTRNGDIYTAARVSAYDMVCQNGIYTGNGSSFLQADGNIVFSGGMTSVGATLHQALGAKAGFSGSTNVAETNFPIGHTIQYSFSGLPNRNSAVSPCIYNSNSGQYVNSNVAGAGAGLAGTWLHRGAYSSGNVGTCERAA